MSELGRVLPPYGGQTKCAASDCGNSELNEVNRVYLHRDLERDKIVLLCGPCSAQAELTARHRLPLVAL